MKKLWLISALIFSFTSLYAAGEEIYKEKCASCHAMKGMMDSSEMKSMREKMQNVSKEEKMLMRQKMMNKMEKSHMKAPPMPMVSKRLKMKFKTKEAFVAFVTDYIQNPSKEKGLCMPMAYKRFGTMPPIGKHITAEERKEVAQWLYDNFKDSWDGSMSDKMCDMKTKGMMKCGSAKCGSNQKNTDQSPIKIQTH